MVFKQEKQFLRFLFAARRAVGLAKADPFAVCFVFFAIFLDRHSLGDVRCGYFRLRLNCSAAD
jgi:hypothetical protein